MRTFAGAVVVSQMCLLSLTASAFAECWVLWVAPLREFDACGDGRGRPECRAYVPRAQRELQRIDVLASEAECVGAETAASRAEERALGPLGSEKAGVLRTRYFCLSAHWHGPRRTP